MRNNCEARLERALGNFQQKIIRVSQGLHNKNMHISVLPQETLDFLNPQKGETIVDATVDGGGHAVMICKKLGEGGMLVAIDEDSLLLKETFANLSKIGPKIVPINGNFRHIENLLNEEGIAKVDGVLFDFGMSSNQIENSGRGFSFDRDEPLLMTYDPNPEPEELTAYQVVNSWSEQDLADIIFRYGEERYARRIAKAIIEARKEKPVVTTYELKKIIEDSVPAGYREGKIHPATRTFQAIRIAVNDELNAVREGLVGAWQVLSPQGRLVAISFHSLEDRIVKHFLKDKHLSGEGALLTKKPNIAGEKETSQNRRARSAKLRAITKK